ncbi:hypothetical protein [Cellulomonas sp. PS-H5]|uniref:hypothetical protein n=1 Tax=Cellulomonas sp. PS-H5 TaxID=2820400 RepID=UPI001C4FCBEF|nr:hypothetical protein [Cellulomonas sp. PS-H5]MBW0254715.1 hypothetical protein [Cellulomonas sp. PS-H5]
MGSSGYVAGALALLAVAVVVALLLSRGGVVVKSGAMSGCVSLVRGTTWRTTAHRIDGHCRVDASLDAGRLAALRVTSTSSSGRVVLLLSQEGTTRSVDLSGGFDGPVDTHGFEPGTRTRLRVDFRDARDVRLDVRWG